MYINDNKNEQMNRWLKFWFILFPLYIPSLLPYEMSQRRIYLFGFIGFLLSSVELRIFFNSTQSVATEHTSH